MSVTKRVSVEFSDNAHVILCKRYLTRLGGPHSACKRCGDKHETPEEMLDRVSFGNNDYYNIMARLEFLPNSPTLFNAGVPGGAGTLSACFKFDIKDTLLGDDEDDGGVIDLDMSSIMGVAVKSAAVQKYGGGVGYALSALRSKSSSIRSTHGRACGPVAVMKTLLHSVAMLITQGGKREGAQMGILSCDHPDIREFIHAKDDDPQATSSFNISVAATDEFMRQATEIEGSEEHALLRDMAESAWKTGDPGVYFIDEAERHNPTPWVGKLTGTNPCGEVPLLDGEPCNLGSINVAKFVEPGEDGTLQFNHTKLSKLAGVATRFLDEILDHNKFPFDSIRDAALLTRKLGLGVMGWADSLALMGIDYDSKEAVDLGHRVMGTISLAAYSESVALAQEKGSCMGLDMMGADQKRTPKRRNATTTCIAPTGSIAILADASSGIEPHFALTHRRTLGDGTVIEENIPVLDRLGDFVPHTSMQIPYSYHILHQAAFQKHTDLAVSKTINLPNHATPQDIYDAYVMAWNTKCKGITVYRDGSRAFQVLNATVPDQAEAAPDKIRSIDQDFENLGYHGRKRLPATRESVTHRFEVGGVEGYVTFGLYANGQPGELFITASKQGSTMSGLLDSVAILTSMALQHGVPLETLVHKMSGRRFEPLGFTSNPDIPATTSVIDYIFRFASKQFLEREGREDKSAGRPSGSLCPECGSGVLNLSGCLSCENVSCGWSRC